MKILFVGDMHGFFEHLTTVAKRTNADKIVQVGDLGIMPRAGYNLPANLVFTKPTYFIEGNHDDVDYIERQTEWPDNLHYMVRGADRVWDGMRFGFLGGGDSIDKYARTEGVDWFRRELPTLVEVEMLAKRQPDVVVTHECPAFITKEYFGFTTDDPLAYDLQNALKHIPKFKPKVWFFGHHHRKLLVKHDGILFCGLACFGMEGDEAMLDTERCMVEIGRLEAPYDEGF